MRGTEVTVFERPWGLRAGKVPAITRWIILADQLRTTEGSVSPPDKLRSRHYIVLSYSNRS
jgi:hypothetical protein